MYISRRMKVTFRDKSLELLETPEATRTKLPIAVIESCRRKFRQLRAAPDERTLRNLKSLHYEKLKGDRDGQRSIRVNDQWRIVFELDDTTSPPTIEVLAVEDYH